MFNSLRELKRKDREHRRRVEKALQNAGIAVSFENAGQTKLSNPKDACEQARRRVLYGEDVDGEA